MPGSASNSDYAAWARGPRTDFSGGLTLPQIFAKRVAESPQAPAVVEAGRVWSYGELDRRANAVSRALPLDLPVGSAIGVRQPRSAAFVAIVLGILKAGYCYLPIDGQEPASRRALREADCAHIWDGETKEAAETPVERTVTEEQPAYILYTSGSTGTPKGVIVPHRAISRLVCKTNYLTIEKDDVFAFHSNLSFDASTLEIWAPLLNGASLVVTETETVLSAAALRGHLAEHRITRLWLTTSLFNRISHEAADVFAPLRTLIFGGEAADPLSVRRVLESKRPRQLINGYGPTETTTFAVCHEINRLEGEIVPIGRPIANTDAYILDERLMLVEEGEIYIGGPGVALGYLGQPALTAERFLETSYGRLYKTGDRARWQSDGKIQYLGRVDRQIKMRGFRIEPGEIEAAMRKAAGVGECAVIARAAPSGETVLVGYYSGGPVEAEMRELLRGALPAHMAPAVLIRMESLPLTANGKLDSGALPAPRFGARAAVGVAPATETERRLAGIWQELLGIAEAGVEDNFFDLGGSSVLILALQARVSEEFGRLVTAVDLFQHPTVRTLGKFLDDAGKGASVSEAQARAARQRAALDRWRRRR